jgi:PST family polysaccharide transporter
MLKSQVVKGISWVGVSNVLKQLFQMGGLFVFAWLLSPDDFGIFTILMIFIGFLTMFYDMGTSSVIVHIKEPSVQLLSSIFYFNIFAGIFLSIFLSIIAPLISAFFAEPELTELLRILSLIFIISSLGVVQKSLFEKKLEFKKVTIIETIAMFLGVVFGIYTAWRGHGVYSFIVQALVNSTSMVILFWLVSGWRPIFHFAFSDIRSVFSWSANLTGFYIINYFTRNVDNFMIGKYLSTSSLGVYSLAYKIMVYPIQNISHVIVRVLFPALSIIKEDLPLFRRSYLKVIFYIALVAFPIMTGLIAVADSFVLLFFGEKWTNLAHLLLILAPVGMLQSIVTTIGSIYMATGHVNTMLKMSVLNSVVIIICFIVGLKHGVEGMAVAYFVANFLMFYPNIKIAWGKIGLSVTKGIKEIFPVFTIATIMGILVHLLGINLFYQVEQIKIQLLLMILSGVAIYLALLKIHYKSLTGLIKNAVK